MPTGSEVELYRNIGRIAHALERIATVLENEQQPGGLPEPPEHLAEAWRRFQAGEDLPAHEARALDEWRVDCARDAGF
jgi:hypothetical protein